VLEFSGTATALPTDVEYPHGTVGVNSHPAAAQFVPGHVVLALANEVLALGGKIRTGVRATSVTPASSGNS
jgi:hypothetical protein